MDSANFNISFAASEDFRIDQVIYNEDIDITELVKKVKSKKG